MVVPADPALHLGSCPCTFSQDAFKTDAALFLGMSSPPVSHKALFFPLFLTDDCWLRCIPALKTSVSSLASPDTFVSNFSRTLLASSEAKAALRTSCVMGL